MSSNNEQPREPVSTIAETLKLMYKPRLFFDILPGNVTQEMTSKLRDKTEQDRENTAAM
jgi:hypothetical protein